MKVKHLLLALAIPSAFAACSQDEFVNGTQGPNDNRPVVGPVSLDLSSGSSRWDWSSALGFTFDNNDYMGACQMDVVGDLTQDDWAKKYTISNNINTNYKYGYKDGWSNNDAIMSEGNYFFYMPYNNELKSRGALPYAIPAEQYAYDEETPTVANATLAWKKNQMFIGYDDMMVGDKAAKPILVEAHAKPRFNIKYTGSDAVVIERIVLTDETGNFGVEGAVKAAAKATAKFNPITGLGAPSTYETVSATPDLAECFRAYNKAVAEYERKEGQLFVNPLADNAAEFLEATTSKEVSALSLNFVPAKEVTGLMVMPAGTHTLANVKVQIYTNKGLVEFTVASDKLENATQGTGITYSNMNTLTAIKPGDGVKDKAVNINFADVDVKQPAEVSVSTTSQLESVIRWYATGEKNVAITILGDKVEMSQIVYDTIKGNSKLAVTFKGQLTIPVAIASDALDLLVDAGTGTVTIAGTQNLINDKTATLAYDIKVLEGATLNITAGGTTTTVAKIANNGTVNIKGGKLVATEITNEAALTINATATVEAKVLNNAIAKVNGSITTYSQNAVITNNGNLILEASSVNQSIIDNNNKLTILGTTTNSKVAAMDKGTNGYTGIINNKDKSASYIYVQAAFGNEGNIFNTGALYSQASGVTTNTGYIKAEDGSTTYVTDNAAGEIELAKRNTETTVNSTNKGFISYTMISTDLDKDGAFAVKPTSDKFNTLRVGMGVSFAKTTAPANIILNGSNFTVNCADGTSFESIKATGTSRYIVQGIKVETKVLDVSDTAVFQIPALSTFGVYNTTNGIVTVSQNAEVLVGGKFYANLSDGKQPAEGTFSSAGNGSYDWNDTTKNFGVVVTP